MDPAETLLHAIGEHNHAKALAIIEFGFNLNQPIDNGAPRF
jgi:hypothetical protein